MNDTPRHILYDILLKRDARYDGKMFFAVTSTGIFCRPICPARKPKPENVLYFSDADAPRIARFRACKRCRPETRPGSPAWKGTEATIIRAMRILARGDSPDSMAELADELGVSDRHLRRLFQKHLGRSPIEIRNENRLNLAEAMLTDPTSQIADIAFASGFKSLRRFNTAFRQHYKISPSEWRTANGHTL
ncbi:bifunctional transcriptional activator/DNA repair enzyme AdaA [Kordiimonas laminariae]|uniref:bifunctional transcriptional activator/DNA repair enzyme AdaA n=1 Tax=Kordiimonas laminariae TaxID=2917717 RepID=UPI001FF1F97D|nr:Ada metal-binding domain-containing protein [Kordiimonas laminariae]MCK0068388.1 helix-turn-helix domain-containing protein [Kordiimonas laminariae]